MLENGDINMSGDVVEPHPSFAFFGESDPGPEYLRCFRMWIVHLQRYPDVEESV